MKSIDTKLNKNNRGFQKKFKNPTGLRFFLLLKFSLLFFYFFFTFIKKYFYFNLFFGIFQKYLVLKINFKFLIVVR